MHVIYLHIHEIDPNSHVDSEIFEGVASCQRLFYPSINAL